MTKMSMIIAILFVQANLFAQTDVMKGNIPRYRVRLITISDNMLKGLLLEIKDSSLVIYPGKRKEWRKVHYKPVEFVYSNIKHVAIRRKNGSWKEMLIGGGLRAASVIVRQSWAVNNHTYNELQKNCHENK